MNELMNMNSEQKNSSVYLVEQINLFRKEEGINPSSILAITFTNKALNEMKSQDYDF